MIDSELETIHSERESLTLALQLVALRQEARALGNVPEIDGRIAYQTAHTLAEQWGLQRHPQIVLLARAAVLKPLIEHASVAPDVLAQHYGSAAVQLAQALLAWQARFPLHSASDPVAFSLQLRTLYHTAYLNRPHFALPLLILASHDTQLRIAAQPQPHGGAAPTLWPIAALTQHVFIPFAKMLGLWCIRRSWIKQIMQLLYPADFNTMQQAVLQVEPEWNQIEAEFAAKVGSAAHTLGLDGIETLDVKRVRRQVGTLLHHHKAGKPLDETLHYLCLRIKCHTPDQCYRLLGAVHRFGQPVAPRFSERFDDYIASPQLNGYRALHTAILYPYRRHDGSAYVPLKVRITTAAMHKVNEWGLLAELRGGATRDDVPAWWRQPMAVQSGRISPRHRRMLEHNHEILLAQHGLGTQTDPLYVFTPSGELVFLPQFSTPLDFAYHIHSNLGNKLTRVFVNGTSEAYNVPLHNGDLIQVFDSPTGPGPDITWLSMANTHYARGQIRRSLNLKASTIHPGRATLEAALIKEAQVFANTKRYALTITTRQFDQFIIKACAFLNLPDPLALYEAVATRALAPGKIVYHLVQEQLGALVVRPDGSALAVAPQQLRICLLCRPVPGEAIIGVYQRANKRKQLVIHSRNAPDCAHQIPDDAQVAVCWATAPAGQSEQMVFQVVAHDRTGLLLDLLRAIDAVPATYLNQANAQTQRDGTADVTLVLAGADIEHISQARGKIEGVPGVLHVALLPPSPTQRVFHRHTSPEHQTNPYITDREVYGRLDFFDREQISEWLLNWVAGPAALLVLHGQRRVGKSSLLKHMAKVVLPEQRLAHAVYIDMHALTRYDGEGLAGFLAQHVYDSLKLPLPPQRPSEQPIAWLNRILDQAVQHCGRTRLVIMLDESAMLLECERMGLLDRLTFRNLRAVLSQQRSIHWLMVVQDSYLHDPAGWGGAASLFEKAHRRLVPHFDQDWGLRLMSEPARRANLLFQSDAIPLRVARLSDGNPYVIQTFGYYLFERVRAQQRTNVTFDDLDQVQALLLADGQRLFNHLLSDLTTLGKLVLSAVSESTGADGWADEPAVHARLQGLPARQARALPRTIGLLCDQRVLATDGQQPTARLRIPMELFRMWVASTIDPLALLHELRASQR